LYSFDRQTPEKTGREPFGTAFAKTLMNTDATITSTQGRPPDRARKYVRKALKTPRHFYGKTDP